jgi:2-keto-3-deoxy-L-rhamnonate aldolase RhmA
MTGVSGIDNLDDLLAVEGVDVFFIVLYWPGRSN